MAIDNRTTQEPIKRVKCVDTWQLSKRLCEALGLDMSTTTSLTIDIKASEPLATITVEMIPTEEVLNLDWGELLKDLR